MFDRAPRKAYLVLADESGDPIVGFEFPSLDHWELNHEERDFLSFERFIDPYRFYAPEIEITVTLKSHTMIQHAPTKTTGPEWTPTPTAEIEPPRKEVES